MITVERLKEVLGYDPVTGLFTWLVKTSIRVKVGATAGWKNNGYVYIAVDGKDYLAHRLAVLYMTGVWPVDEVDHRDRNRGNNKWVNLRSASRVDNARNIGKRKTNTSGVKGVYWNKEKGKYQAQTTVNNKQISLGRYDDLADAEQAYINYVAPLHNDFLNVN